MIKRYFFILFVLAFCFSSCSPNKANYAIQTPLDMGDIDSITISNQPTDKVPSTIRYLTLEQSKVLVDKWNNATTIGPCKYVWTYNVEVYLINKTKKNFRINGSIMKEDNDWGFDLADKNYIDQLWLSAIVKNN